MTNNIELSNFIKKNIHIDDEDLKIVLSYFKTIRKKKNDVLLSNGKNSQASYFVKKGCLRLFYINEEKNVVEF